VVVWFMPCLNYVTVSRFLPSELVGGGWKLAGASARTVLVLVML